MLDTPIVDFQYYSRFYHGELEAEAFSEKILAAQYEVDKAIYPNEVEPHNLRAYKDSICALCDYIADEDAGIESWRVGETTETYSSEKVDTPVKILNRYLSGSGLLSRWL